MRHIIESQQFDRKTIETLFKRADSVLKTNKKPLRGKIMASLFYEPSTRTRFSFESAMIRLGGEVITTENAGEFSSAAKGETLEDTIRVVGNYADLIVLRHAEKGASGRAAAVSNVPIINAGDGAGQHPTQALLDLYTLKKELGKIDGIEIALLGDLKHSRTFRSLAYMMGKFKGVKIYFASPRSLQIGADIKEYLKRHAVEFHELRDVDGIINQIDALYVNRIQKERFENKNEYKKVKGSYIVNVELVKKMKKGSIVMNPLPRIDEITPEVDLLPHAVYFKQVKYGLLIRMALLQNLLK